MRNCPGICLEVYWNFFGHVLEFVVDIVMELVWNCPGLSMEIVLGFYARTLCWIVIRIAAKATKWQRQWAQRTPKPWSYAAPFDSVIPWASLMQYQKDAKGVNVLRMRQGASKYVQTIPSILQSYFNHFQPTGVHVWTCLNMSEHPAQGVHKKPPKARGQASVWKALSNARSTCRAQSRQVHSLKESLKCLIHLFAATKCWSMFMSYTKKRILS